jgi:hypothetical protein
MEYPRPIMSITEMHRELAFPIEDLRNAVHIPGQKFAWKTVGGGKWLIDTAEYEKFRLKRR